MRMRRFSLNADLRYKLNPIIVVENLSCNYDDSQIAVLLFFLFFVMNVFFFFFFISGMKVWKNMGYKNGEYFLRNG